MSSYDIQLSAVERHLMSFYKRSGTPGMVVLVTVVSVLGSMLITMGLIYPTAAPEVARDGFWYFLGGSVGVPLLIAPVATLLIARLLVLLERSFEVVKALSTTDPLTGSANRRGFFSVAEQNIRTLRGNHVCALGMVDLNDFKVLNDEHGHKAGDMALVNIAKALQECIGEAGTVGRIGGDEFALLIIAEPVRLEQIRTQIVSRCTQLVFTTASGRQIGLSASVGIVQLEENEGFDEALVRADAFLYKQKKKRRGRAQLNSVPRPGIALSSADG